MLHYACDTEISVWQDRTFVVHCTLCCILVLGSVYTELASAFGKTLDRMGRGQRDESPGAQHRKITLHSHRRYAYSAITDLGYSDYTNFCIDHFGSTYYRMSEEERTEIFKKIEPYLTFLDYEELERKGADVVSQLEEKDRMIQHMSNFVHYLYCKRIKL